MLRYDFDMIPAGTAACSGGSQNQYRKNAVVAFFKDPETTDAVTSAPPIVRLFLEEAGFDLSASDKLTAECSGRESDAQLRRALAAQLTAALSNRALKKALARAAQKCSFDVAAFVSAVVAKEPSEPPHDAQDQVKPRKTVTPRRPCELRGRGIKSRLRPYQSA